MLLKQKAGGRFAPAKGSIPAVVYQPEAKHCGKGVFGDPVGSCLSPGRLIHPVLGPHPTTLHENADVRIARWHLGLQP